MLRAILGVRGVRGSTIKPEQVLTGANPALAAEPHHATTGYWLLTTDHQRPRERRGRRRERLSTLTTGLRTTDHIGWAGYQDLPGPSTTYQGLPKGYQRPAENGAVRISCESSWGSDLLGSSRMRRSAADYLPSPSAGDGRWEGADYW